jgi:hypothetical protein
MHESPELNSQEQAVICFIEMDNAEAVDTGVTWFLFNHCIDHLSPAIVAVAMTEGVLEDRVMSRPNCPPSAVYFFKVIVVCRKAVGFDKSMIVTEVPARR